MRQREPGPKPIQILAVEPIKLRRIDTVGYDIHRVIGNIKVQDNLTLHELSAADDTPGLKGQPPFGLIHSLRSAK